MTTAEFAASLGLTPHTVRVQIANGKIRARKVGRDYNIAPSEVERYRRASLGTRRKAKPFLQPAIDAAKAKMTPEQRALLDAPLPADFVPRFCPAPKPSQRKRAKVSAE